MKWRSKRMNSLFIGLIILMVFGVISVFALEQHVERTGASTLVTMEEAEDADAILVLGAYVHPNGQVSRMLKDRLDYGYKLYALGKAKKIIISGDHGSKSYNEVKAMCSYLEGLGVPSEDIFMDHAGFNTYDSIYRMKAIFEVDKAIVVSQAYHAVRAAYIAKRLGIDVQSVASDTYVYEKMLLYRIREIGARVKAFWMAGITKPNPTYLGEVIPITGSGLKTRD